MAVNKLFYCAFQECSLPTAEARDRFPAETCKENILTMRAQAEQNAAHMASLQKYLTEFKDNVTEELNNQSDMLTDITNNLQVKFIFHSE
jgi:hypothetical protein